MIKSLRLVNWKSHLESGFEFSAGVNALLGIIGSGKSSVTDAISFALYGTFPAMKSGRVAMDDVIMDAPSRKDFAEVEMELELEGKRYAVKRVIERGKGTRKAEIRENGILIDVNSRNVNEHVERLLKMDYDLFSKAVYSEQNSMDFFLRIPKGQRMLHIDRMLQVDRYEKAREAAVSIANSYSQKAGDFREVLKGFAAEGLEAERESLEQEVKNISAEGMEIRQGFQTASQERRRLQENVQTLERIETELGKIRERIAACLSGAAQISESLGEIGERLAGMPEQPEKDMDSVLAEMGRIEKNIGILRNSYSDLRGEFSAALARMEGCSRDMERLQAEIVSCRQAAEESGKIITAAGGRPGGLADRKRSELNAQERRFAENMAAIKSLKAHINELEGSSCPVCGSALEARQRENLIEMKMRGVEEAAVEAAGAEREISRLGKEIMNLERDARRLALLEESSAKLGDMEAAIKEKMLMYSSLSGDREGIEKKLALCAEKIDGSEKELDAFRARRDRLREILKDVSVKEQLMRREKILETELAGFREKEDETGKTFSPGELADARENLREMLAREKVLESRISSLALRLEEKQDALAGVRKRIETRSRLERDAGGFSTVSRAVGEFAAALGDTQRSLRAEFVGLVNMAMKAVWAEIYPYSDFTDIRLAADEDYVLELFKSGKWYGVDGSVSGGERSVACLALRISFCLAFIPNLRWLILDEPTHNLDRNAIEKLSSIFQEKIGTFAEQVFLITHEPEIARGSATAYTLTRDKRANGPTTVEAGGQI